MGVCGLIVWGLAVVSVAGSARAEPRAASALLIGQAEPAEPPAAFKRVCSGCHVSDRIVQGRRFRSQWEEVLEKMGAEGAVGTDEDFTVILDYLVSEFGRVRVNVASAPEFAKVMHIEPSQAEVIVEYRKTNGKFADFAALVAVPGVPVEALSKRRDALFF